MLEKLREKRRLLFEESESKRKQLEELANQIKAAETTVRQLQDTIIFLRGRIFSLDEEIRELEQIEVVESDES